ncbi:MAG: hypothetical protein LBK94_06515 [Prevotellaceae bacterium]|jgi:hypothetical protein|nr:hypothetical protein [Prevotellaceae bacterium]
MAKKKSTEKSFYIPVNVWNLNEIFTTESISPVSFYRERNFGNPVNRNQEKTEDINNLILFDNEVQSKILLKIIPDLLDLNCLTETKSSKKEKLKSFEYSKTIYLKTGFFKVIFNSQANLNEFLNSTFMLLEVKAINKYKSEFIVNENVIKNKTFYQSQILSNKNEKEPHFDKAFNQIKGLIYGYVIGLLGTLSDKEQELLTELTKLKNTVGGVHTEIALSETYSNYWLINIRKQIKDCHKIYFENFGKQPDVFDTLLLRLEEIDKLNKMRCETLAEQKEPEYKEQYYAALEDLEKAKRELYKYECQHEITQLKKELEEIETNQRAKSKAEGKKKAVYKKGSYEYERRKEIEKLISNFEKDNKEYEKLKNEVKDLRDEVRNFQFGVTQFDTSISEQFSRISEYLHEITKKSTTYFLSKNNKASNSPDISFDFDTQKLADYYFNRKIEYFDFGVKFSKSLTENLSESEQNLLAITINAIFAQPQGRLGNFSEQSILEIIENIGKHLPKGEYQDTLRDYYLYRIGKNDTFNFPENAVLANLIVFLMKLAGHEQINKMLVSKNIVHKEIAFMLYGAYIGFANMPKTFTNLIFDSENNKLQNLIDNYLFNNYL